MGQSANEEGGVRGKASLAWIWYAGDLVALAFRSSVASAGARCGLSMHRQVELMKSWGPKQHVSCAEVRHSNMALM